MFWNKTITLYNRHEDDQTGIIKWYRHNLRRCFFKITDNKQNVGSTQLATNDSIIRIPKQINYLPPCEWLELSGDDKATYMTLQGGDLIFLGDITDEIDELMQGQRSSDLIEKYNALGSVVVKSVNINTDLPGAHYCVRGE